MSANLKLSLRFGRKPILCSMVYFRKHSLKVVPLLDIWFIAEELVVYLISTIFFISPSRTKVFFSQHMILFVKILSPSGEDIVILMMAELKMALPGTTWCLMRLLVCSLRNLSYIKHIITGGIFFCYQNVPNFRGTLLRIQTQRELKVCSTYPVLIALSLVARHCKIILRYIDKRSFYNL